MGRDKATRVTVDGQPLVTRVAAALTDAGAAEIVTIGGDLGALSALGLDARADRHPGEGPLGGILTAFAEVTHPLVVIAACDLPWLDGATVRAVLEAAVEGGADVALAHGDRREPLCGGWWVPRCREVLERAFAAGERAVHRAVEDLRVVDVDAPPTALHNVNTQDDLAER
jgi:molybdopterin-guanine dinucleotide biosynthesis protein A